jgi:hypothetical protein
MGRLKLRSICPGGSEGGGDGEGEMENTSEHDTRFTQVQGPCEEVKPLLLLVCDV